MKNRLELKSLFKYDTRFEIFKAIDSHNWWQYANLNIWMHKWYLRLSNVLNCSLFLAERHFYDFLILFFHFLCWHVCKNLSFNNVINLIQSIWLHLLSALLPSAVTRSGYIEPGSRGHPRAGPNVPSPAVTKHCSWKWFLLSSTPLSDFLVALDFSLILIKASNSTECTVDFLVLILLFCSGFPVRN